MRVDDLITDRIIDGIERYYNVVYIVLNEYTYNLLIEQLDYMTVFENKEVDPVPKFHGIEILIRKDNKDQINIEVI